MAISNDFWTDFCGAAGDPNLCAGWADRQGRRRLSLHAPRKFKADAQYQRVFQIRVGTGIEDVLDIGLHRDPAVYGRTVGHFHTGFPLLAAGCLPERAAGFGPCNGDAPFVFRPGREETAISAPGAKICADVVKFASGAAQAGKQ